jgi:hypothetical protein
MDPIGLLICAALAIGAAWVIAQPLLKGPEAPPPPGGQATNPHEAVRLLQVERDILYQSIHELDLDYAAGKLSEADYRALRAKQEAQAVNLLKALDSAAPTGRPPAPRPPAASA